MLIALVFCFSVLLCANGQVIVYSLPEIRNVGDLCATQMDALVSALSIGDVWALKMLDASSKIPTGMLTGNLFDMGSFDECVMIEHNTESVTIKGKHCLSALLIQIGAETSHLNTASRHFNISRQTRDDTSVANLALSLCIPDGCMLTEVSEYLNVQGLQTNDGQCQTIEREDLNGGDIAVVSFLSVILFLIIASTVYDVYLNKRNQTSAHPIFLAFSVVSNGKKILALNNNNESQLSSLHGLRCLSMIWIVAGHRFSTYANLPSMNMFEVDEWPSKLYTQYIQASYVAVDTFFFLSGMMISYGYFKTVKKPKSVSFVPMYYIHRYLRITPAAGVLFIVTVTIMRHFGTGPLWPTLSNFTRDPCLKWWWSYFLYVQNYVNYDDLCIIPTWYLSADMQMFLLSPLILLPLGYITVRKSKKIVYSACVSLLLLFMVIQAVVKLNVESNNEYMTHERLSVWMIGFTTGILLEEIKSKKSKVNMNHLLNLCIWVVVLVGMISILLTMHDVRQNPERLETNMFDTFHRPAWSLGLAWIVYSCTIGYGGFVNWFLSLPSFQILSRMTYCMYLVHTLPIIVSAGQLRMPWYFTEFNIFYAFCGDIICTMILALVWVLAFESPMITIEKYVFGLNRGTKGKVKKDNVAVAENAGLPKV